jgi:hypothetical protein
MSEQELYDVARQRIDRRNRRWIIWFIHLALLVAYVGAFILLTNTSFVLEAVALLVVWGGVFTLHTVYTFIADSREKDIEAEVAKLRSTLYEKPKRTEQRLELRDDGELVEAAEEPNLRRSARSKV